MVCQQGYGFAPSEKSENKVKKWGLSIVPIFGDFYPDIFPPYTPLAIFNLDRFLPCLTFLTDFLVVVVLGGGKVHLAKIHLEKIRLVNGVKN